jgi:hypothetical protein
VAIDLQMKGGSTCLAAGIHRWCRCIIEPLSIVQARPESRCGLCVPIAVVHAEHDEVRMLSWPTNRFSACSLKTAISLSASPRAPSRIAERSRQVANPNSSAE